MIITNKLHKLQFVGNKTCLYIVTAEIYIMFRLNYSI